MHALAAPGIAAVAQLDRLELPGRGPGGDRGSPRAPESRATSTSTVGLPLESRIWRRVDAGDRAQAGAELNQTRRHVSPRASLAADLDRLLGGLSLDLAEDVRVATDQLLGQALGDGAQVADAALLQQQGEEQTWKSRSPSSSTSASVVAGEGRIRHLVALLDGVRDDRALVLLAVPGHSRRRCRVI